MLGNHPAWFGRGPSGYLLGPFRTRQSCGQAILNDIEEADQVGVDAWVPNEVNRDMDMQAHSKVVASITNEPLFPTYRILIPGVDKFFAVAGPEGVIEGFRSPDSIAASNKASASRIAFTAGV